MRGWGVDGCRGGWFCFGFGGGDPEWRVVASLHELMERIDPSSPVFVDIPIGLLSGGSSERRCDIAARRALSPVRGSSVFPTPSRSAVQASSYDEAQLLNRKALGKGLSKQTWGIAPRIREVDDLLESCPQYRGRVREAHPEVCFWGLQGSPMSDYKKTRAGFNARLEALERHMPNARQAAGQAFLEHGGFEAQRDDILDAMVAALCAFHTAECVTLPESPAVDDRGLAMEMVYWPAGRGP